MSGCQVTGGWNVITQLQFIEETTFGVTPTASPAFSHAGPIVELNDSQEAQAIKYRQIGSRDIYSMIKTGEMYSFDVTFNPIDDALMNYAINLPGVGSQNIGKSLSFIKSQLVGGSEYWTLYKGCRAESCDVSIEQDGAVEVSITYQCRDITTPSSTHGLTTPTFGPNPTTIPWTNLTPGSGPFVYGTTGFVPASGTIVDTPSFSFSVTNNLERVKPNGDLVVKCIEPTLRDCTVEFDTWYTKGIGFTMIGNQKALSANEAIYKLSTNKLAALEDLYLETMGASDSTSATEPKLESFTGTAKAIAIQSY